MRLSLNARWLAVVIAVLAAAVVTELVAHERHGPNRYGGHPRGVVVHVVQTTADLSQRMQRLPDMRMEPGGARVPMVVHVQDRVRYQTILGFGAALTDSSAFLIRDALTPAARNGLMRELFSPTGIDLNYIRLPMGASDFTARGKPYSYDDMPGKSDPGLRHFSVAHDLPYIIPTLRQARAIDPKLFIIANPWSAPAWMKTNHRFDNVRNTGTLLPVYYPLYAAYFVKFLQAYRRHDVTVDAVTPQNEPGVAEDPAMNLPEPDEAAFLTRYLYPALAAARLRPKVYGLDMSWTMAAYAAALARSPAAAGLTGISWHCYLGSPAVMTLLHALAPRLTQLVNECSPELVGFTAAQVLIGSLRNWASVVALWNFALDPAGGPVQPPGTWCLHCIGLVTVDRATHSAQPGLWYYQLGQVSKYVARGAVRIGANTFVTDEANAGELYRPTVGLDDVAFVNPDGERVLVNYNSSPGPIQFGVSWHGRTLLYRQPAGATTTFTWRES